MTTKKYIKLLAVQHGAWKRIGVEYLRGVNEAGLKVTLYHSGNGGVITSKQVFQFYNPAEVTKWFKGWSKANLAAWQHAYHTSGLTGDDFARPGGSLDDVVIKAPYVSYHTQRNNERFPSGSCQVTSYAMDFVLYGVKTIENKYSQPEDNIEYYMAKNGLDRHSHADLVKMAQAHGLDATFHTGLSLDNIRAELRRGFPVIVSGQFTNSGHIVLVIGTKGKDFVVHDPWGDYNATDEQGRHYRNDDGSAATNGRSRIYSAATMRDVLITKRRGRGPIWAHYVHPIR